MANTNLIIPEYNTEFINLAAQLKEQIRQKYIAISKEITPEYDGTGRKVVKQRPDGKDYIEEAFMRSALDNYFPGWSWEMAAPLQLLGSEWVIAQGHLIIIDELLIGLGIFPPVRKFYGTDAVRIQFSKNMPHTVENVIDIGDNCQSANTGAFKRAVNRLCHIGDDIYGKRVELEGAGDADFIINHSEDMSLSKKMFDNLIKGKRASEIMSILGVQSMNEVTDLKWAYNKVKETIG